MDIVWPLPFFHSFNLLRVCPHPLLRDYMCNRNCVTVTIMGVVGESDTDCDLGGSA